MRRSETSVESMHILNAVGCRPWDVCAGSIIAQEAGCLVAGSHTSPLDNDVNQEVLEGRKYIVIRAIGDSEVRLTLFLIYNCIRSTLIWFFRSRRRRASTRRRD